MPGWGAEASAYAPGLPPGWRALTPPPFHAASRFEDYVEWLDDELRTERRVLLAGHSMGGALAVLAAAERPDAVERLTLISPAGLPLSKPMLRSGLQFFTQVAQRRFPVKQAATSIAGVAAAPKAALRIALEVRRLDLTPQMQSLAAAGVPVTVIGCSSDTLVTAESCRHAATLLGARYDELEVEGGHMWMFGRWPTFQALLAG